MEDFGYIKDEKKKDLPLLTKKIALSCATLFSISCFIYITINAYYYVYEGKNENVETIKSPEGPIKVIEEDAVAIEGESPKINDSIYEDIFGAKKESLVKPNSRIRISPEPALPPKNLADEKIIGESVPDINVAENSNDKEKVVEPHKPTKKRDSKPQQLLVYSDQTADNTNTQDLLTKGKAEPKSPTKKLSDQKLDKPKDNKRRYVRVQVAALTSKKSADEYWRKISKNSDLVSGLKPFTEEVDLGKKGVFFRLQIGNFSDQVEADDFCKKYTLQMHKSKADCIVVE